MHQLLLAAAQVLFQTPSTQLPTQFPSLSHAHSYYKLSEQGLLQTLTLSMQCHMAETMAESEPARSSCNDSARPLHPTASLTYLLLACCVLIVPLVVVMSCKLVQNEMLPVPSSDCAHGPDTGLHHAPKHQMRLFKEISQAHGALLKHVASPGLAAVMNWLTCWICEPRHRGCRSLPGSPACHWKP